MKRQWDKFLDFVWPAIAYLPEKIFWVDCGTCLFWRGAAVGAVLTGGVFIAAEWVW